MVGSDGQTALISILGQLDLIVLKRASECAIAHDSHGDGPLLVAVALGKGGFIGCLLGFELKASDFTIFLKDACRSKEILT